MKNLTAYVSLFVAALLLAHPIAGRGQDFFRELGTSRSSGGIGPVYPSEYSYEDGSPSGLRQLQPGYDPTLPEQTEDADKYNFAIGNIRFGLAAGIGIEWNDNISLSQDHRTEDFIFRPVVNLDASWQISDLNTLKLSVGLSYAKYFSHHEFDTDGVLVSPNSELAFVFYLSSVKFTVRDRFSYQEDSYDIPELSNTANYGRFENQAGVEMEWPINQSINLVAGYDHYNLWTNDNGFQLQDRSIDTVYTKPSIQVSPAIKLGLNVSYSFINFDSSERADGDSLLVGPFVEWQISEFTNLYLEGGYQDLSFDHGSNYNDRTIDQLGLDSSDASAVRDILQDNDDSSNYYVKFEINNRPSDFFRHRLSFSKTAEIGFASNFYDIYNVEYSADWKATERVEVGPTVFYEHYDTSGFLDEKANRVGAAIGVRYHFTNSLTLGLDYRYIYKDSNLDGADYYQNLAFLSLYYKF